MTTEKTQTDTLELERIRVGVEKRVRKSRLMDCLHGGPNISIDEDIADFLTFRLEGYLFGRTWKDVETRYRWPATWWDAVKKRWAPDWFLQRYPVAYEVVYVSGHALFPTLRKQRDIGEGTYRFEFYTKQTS